MNDVNKQLLDALKEIREFNLKFTWSPTIGELCNKAIAVAEQKQTGRCDACNIETGTVRPCDICGVRTVPKQKGNT